MNAHALLPAEIALRRVAALCCLLLPSVLAAAPAVYFMDDQGNELLVLRDDEIPYASLRVVSPAATILISGDLEDEDGKLSFQMSAGLGADEELVTQAGWKVTASLDPAQSRAQVVLETFGKSVTGLPLLLPSANGSYKRVQTEERLRRAREENQLAEAALAAARERVAKVEHPGLQEILKSQGVWEDERLENARLVAESVDEKTASGDVPDYWQTMAEMTRARAQLLLAASGLEARPGFTGHYIDDAGGAIELSVGEGASPKTLAFEISVVRGPTAHTGALAGVAEFKEPDLAVFVDKNEEAFSDGRPATVRFRFRAHELVVEGENTSFYHGLRAFFDGTYYRLPE